MKFTVSIVCHNNLALTKRCVAHVKRSLYRYAVPSWIAEVIVSDNASTDGTAQFLQGETVTPSDNLTILRVNTFYENQGFIAPNLRALEEAQGEFFVLLNNDTEVPEGWLETLAAPFSDPQVMLSGPKGAPNCLSSGFVGYKGSEAQTEYLEGSCLMGRTTVLREIGLFDPKLVGAYGEDADLSLRVRKAGYKLAPVDLNVKHLCGMTSAMVPESKQWFEQNMKYLREKWKDYLLTRKF